MTNHKASLMLALLFLRLIETSMQPEQCFHREEHEEHENFQRLLILPSRD